MPDDKKPIEPNAVSPGEAVHDLTAEISPKNEHGWRRQGFRTPIEGRMENGVRIITYTLEATKASPVFNDRDFPNIRPLAGKQERAEVRKIFDELETVAKVKFVELPAEDAGKADIRFFRHDKTNAGGSSFESKDENGRTVRDIVMSKNETTNQGILLHEILHTMGLSHPGAAKENTSKSSGDLGGDDPRYTTDLTAMSYNSPGAVYIPAFGVRLTSGKPSRQLAAADAETLGALYGKQEEATSKTFTADTLRAKRYLDAHLPATLDIAAGHKGELTIETSGSDEAFGKISGKLSDTDGKKLAQVVTFLTSATQLKDVRMAPDAEVTVNVTGNEENNRLQGGTLGDIFTPRGGENLKAEGDILTGGGGGDRFILDGGSRFNNVVTDWETAKDSVVLKNPITGAELRWRDDFPWGGGRHTGTELLAKDAAGAPIASLFIIGEKPEQVQGRIEGPWEDGGKHHVRIVQDAATTQPTVQAPSTPQPSQSNSQSR